MPFAIVKNQTAAQLMQDAARLLSLPVPIDPMGSTDPNFTLMRTALNNALQELLTEYEWPFLTKEGEIEVYTVLPPDPASSTEQPYPFPEDFFRFIDQTQWNQAMRFPAVGPVAPQAWMTYRVFPISANFTLTWMVRDGQIWFLNPPNGPPGQMFRFMYVSQAFVVDGDDPTLLKNFVAKNSDTVLFDPLITLYLLRLKWLELKEFATDAAAQDFNRVFSQRAGIEKGAAILDMSGGGSRGYPYLSVGNLPLASLYGMRQPS